LRPEEDDLLARAGLGDLAPVEAWTVPGSSRQLSYATHGVFRFFGKFPPPVAGHLISTHTAPGELVIDPMCGSGTTGVECILAHRRSVLGDVNPLALLLARVKTRPIDLRLLDAAVNRITTHLVMVRASIIERKREQAARNALKQILGRTPTEKEVKALADAAPPEPETGHVCSACGGEMPWSKRLGAYWCLTCSHAEYPIAGRTIRLMVPTT
ncbi:MAG: DNA methyltransferase, partial [Gaiellaceae bacterium]